MKAIRYTAAGGVVVQCDQVLVLRRPSRDEVRLPKGHIEKGETVEQAALREVVEESGYADLDIIADLGSQVVEFDYKDAHIIRDERYFVMRLTNEDSSAARQIERQEKELQFIPGWLDWGRALDELTFESEQEWVRRAHQALQQLDEQSAATSVA